MNESEIVPSTKTEAPEGVSEAIGASSLAEPVSEPAAEESAPAEETTPVEASAAAEDEGVNHRCSSSIQPATDACGMGAHAVRPRGTRDTGM